MNETLRDTRCVALVDDDEDLREAMRQTGFPYRFRRK